MTDRTVKVSLILAAQGYMSGMDAVQRKTAETGSEIEKLNQKKQAFTQLGVAAMGFGAAAAAGVGIAISRFADFDQQMSYVQAATHETASNMNLLRDAALEAGARTVYSAAEAAGAVEELAKAGVSTADILSGGLDAALDLAAAGGMQVADAAAVAATTLKQFGLQGEQASHVADLLAAGAGKAQGDVSDMSQALKQGGLVANQFGLSVDETVGTLSAFASAGMLGSDAGTSFRTMLLRLANPSGEAAAKMKELGINAYDAQGQFVGMSGLAGQLQSSLSRLTQEQQNAALAIIFGQDAIRGANVLLQQGAAGIDLWTDKVNDQGYAAETAALRLDNLKGDVEQLGGAFDTALIQSGSGANEALRSLVQIVTGAVGAFTDLPEPVQQGALYLAAAASAVGLLSGAFLIGVPRVAEFKSVVNAAGFSLRGLSIAAVGVTVGLTAVIAIVAAVSQAQAEAKARAEAYADALDQGTSAARKFVAEQLAAKDSFMWLDRGSAIDNAKKLGISIDEVTRAVTGSAAEFTKFKDRVQAAYDTKGQGVEYGVAMQQLTEKVEQLRGAQTDAAQSAKETEAAQKSLSGVTDKNASTTKSAAEAYLDAASGASDLTSQLHELIAAVNEANGVGQDAISKNIDYRNALAGVDETIANAREGVEGYALTLDQSTQAGRDNLDMLVQLAADAQGAADAQFALDGNTDSYRATLEGSRQALIDRAQQLGYNADQAGALADQIFRIPSQTEWKVIAETAQAGRQIDTFIADNSGRQIPLRITAEGISSIRFPNGMVASSNASGNYYRGGKPKEFAAGGFASGIYPATPGGIHRFAEAGYDEAYITMDPAYAARSRAIWEQVGLQLGAWKSVPDLSARAWQSAAAHVPFAHAGGGTSERIVVDQTGATFYSYDPTEVAREQREQLGRALDAAQM